MTPTTVGRVAALVEGRVEGEANRELTGFAPLSTAGPTQLSFLYSTKYRAELEETRAGAVIVGEAVKVERPLTLIRVADPELATALALPLFLPPAEHPGRIMPGAAVDPAARVAEGASVYPLAFVGAGAVIEAEAVILPQAYIGPGVKVGRRSVIHPQATILEGVEVGCDCVIHAGAVIGADGFRFAHRPDGRHVKIPQTGRVIIGDEVEIGANTTIDKATFGATVIGAGVKIDNLVQVAHNVTIGANSILVAQVGLSGSVSLGRNAVLGGQAGVADHINIGDGVMVAAGSGVISDLEPGAVVSGRPAAGRMTTLRIWRNLPRLPDLFRRLAELEERLNSLQAGRKEDDKE